MASSATGSADPPAPDPTESLRGSGADALTAAHAYAAALTVGELPLPLDARVTDAELLLLSGVLIELRQLNRRLDDVEALGRQAHDRIAEHVPAVAAAVDRFRSTRLGKAILP